MAYLIDVPAENVIFGWMTTMILSVTNDLVTDQRVHRIATTLARKGAAVTLVGRVLPASLAVNRDYKTHRFQLLFIKGPFFYLEYNLRLFFYLLFSKVDVLVANDLDTLLANYLVSVIRQKKLVYDTHEYFCGVPELQNRRVIRSIWRCLERIIFPRLDRVYTVNSSIASLYAREYNKQLHVVRNVPVKLESKSWPGRQELGLPENFNLIILQGAGININRGAEEAVDAMQFLEGALLLILGGGDVIDELKIRVKEKELSSKVMFLPKMPYPQMMAYTRLADVGLSLDKDTNINYRYSLPNKIFDYIQAQIPVLGTDLVEVANVINTWQAGCVATSLDPQYLAEQLQWMLTDTHQRNQWKQNLLKAAEKLCWEKEEAALLKVYEGLF